MKLVPLFPRPPNGEVGRDHGVSEPAYKLDPGHPKHHRLRDGQRRPGARCLDLFPGALRRWRQRRRARVLIRAAPVDYPAWTCTRTRLSRVSTWRPRARCRPRFARSTRQRTIGVGRPAERVRLHSRWHGGDGGPLEASLAHSPGWRHDAHPGQCGARCAPASSWCANGPVMGVSGVRSLEALVDGETDPDHLLMLIDRCVQAPRSAARAAHR